MSHFPYQLTGPIGKTATLGLIVLQADETIEQDFRRIFESPDIALYVTRIPSGAEVNSDTLTQMEIDLPRAASLLPTSCQFDVVAYACTSGTTLIGADKVKGLVQDNVQTGQVTNPLTATLAALADLKAKSVAIVSPYVPSVATPVRLALADAGYSVPTTISFGEGVEARVARIDPDSIRDAALEAARRAPVDAIFLSCTNLRTMDIIEDLEGTLNMPVLSSNQALAWHMAKLSGTFVDASLPGQALRS